MALGSREGWKEVLRAGHGEVGTPQRCRGAGSRSPVHPPSARPEPSPARREIPGVGIRGTHHFLPASPQRGHLPQAQAAQGSHGTGVGGSDVVAPVWGGHADAALGPGSRERNAMGTGAEPGPSARASLCLVGHLPRRGNPQTTAVIGAQAGPPRAPPRSPAHMM